MIKRRKINIGRSTEPRTKFNRTYVVMFPLFVFGIIAVFLAIEAASYGARLVHYDNEIIRIEKENRDLSDSLINATSLSKASESTEDMGFTKPSDIVYISKDDSVAKLVQ